MSECSLDLQAAGKPVPAFCERCGIGPCEVWRNLNPPVVEEPALPDDGTKPEPGPTDSRPDPAYTAALSEQSILIEARAKAFELAMKLAAQSDQAETIQFPGLIDVSNRILRYLLEGK